MTIFTCATTLKFAELEGKYFEAWCEAIGKKPHELPDLTAEVEVSVGIDEFDDDEVINRYEEISRPGSDWVERVYRYMAEGDLTAAMDEFSRKFGLAPPSHAKAIADLLAVPKG